MVADEELNFPVLLILAYSKALKIIFVFLVKYESFMKKKKKKNNLHA